MLTGFVITTLLKQLKKTTPTKLQNKKSATVPSLAMVSKANGKNTRKILLQLRSALSVTFFA